MPKIATAEIVGRLKLGSGNIASQIETDEQAEQLVTDVEASVVGADDIVDNMAVCGDERKALGTVQDVQDGFDVRGPEVKKPPVTHHLFGGLYVSTTMAAVAAGWSGFGDTPPRSIMEAYGRVSEYLQGLGYEDGKHVTDHSLDSDEVTECGAMDGAVASLGNSVDAEIREIMDETIANMQGQATVDDLTDRQRTALTAATERLEQLFADGFFNDWDAVKLRRELEARQPGHIEVLKSADDATHGHWGDGLGLVMDEDIEVDRDALYDRRQGRGLFLSSQGFARRIARDIAATETEAEALSLGFDRWTAGVGHKLLAPGMPIVVISKN